MLEEQINCFLEETWHNTEVNKHLYFDMYHNFERMQGIKSNFTIPHYDKQTLKYLHIYHNDSYIHTQEYLNFENIKFKNEITSTNFKCTTVNLDENIKYINRVVENDNNRIYITNNRIIPNMRIKQILNDAIHSPRRVFQRIHKR